MTHLEHIGVLGMRWGIRKRGADSQDHTTARELRKKSVRELSNKEIQTVITRLSLEKQLKNIDAADANRGRGIVSKILGKIGPMLVQAFINRHRNQTPNANDSNETTDSSVDSTEGVVVDTKLLKDKSG